MAYYFYYQETPESAWKFAETKQRDKVLALDPPFTTVLSVNQVVDEDSMSSEDLANLTYMGPMYYDFDSDYIDESIREFKKFLNKLEEKGVDLEECELYATGGRGFHLLVPMEIFVDKLNGKGFKNLPLIYKELAWSMAVNTMDMRVYSAKRGRMWRTQNVLRTNGRYKVRITVDEAKEMNEELYEQLTATKRFLLPPKPPTYTLAYASLFAKYKDKVTSKVSARKSKKDEKLIAQFEGKVPATLESICKGENLDSNSGFQSIATQIAISMVALGQTESQMLEMCEGLVNNHQSDGSRYNTPMKRRKELSRMYHYMENNPCYDFSAGGLISLLDNKATATDLQLETQDEHGATEEDEELELDDDIIKGVRFNKMGIYVRFYDKEAEEWKVRRVSELGIDNVTQVRTLESYEVKGYEFDSYVNGRYGGRRSITINQFGTVGSLQQALGSMDSTTIQVNEAQAKGMLDLFRKKAEISKRVVVSLPREGLDLIKLPNEEGDFTDEIVYVSKGVGGILARSSTDGFKFEGGRNREGDFQVDLVRAPKLEANKDTKGFFDDFFDMYPSSIQSRVMGYFLACHLTQVLRNKFGKFPMLQIFGTAGAGKTAISEIMANLHTYKQPIQIWSAGSTSNFALRSYLENSASIPVVFDEYKPVELGPKMTSQFMMTMRNNYTGNASAQGSISKDVGVSQVIVMKRANAAPLVFLGEQIEDQTAILDRSILVNMTSRMESSGELADKERKRRYRRIKASLDQHQYLGAWGLLCVNAIISTGSETFVEQVNKFEDLLMDAMTVSGGDRPIYNNAVILTGLELGKQVLNSVFGTRYDEKFEQFKNEILTDIDRSMPVNKSENTKVLDTLASLTAIRGSDLQMVEGVDYMFVQDKDSERVYLDIRMKEAWDKYARHRRSQGEAPLFRNEQAFMIGLGTHPACIDERCLNSPLKMGRLSVRICRFDTQTIYNEFLVEEFENNKEFKKLTIKR